MNHDEETRSFRHKILTLASTPRRAELITLTLEAVTVWLRNAYHPYDLEPIKEPHPATAIEAIAIDLPTPILALPGTPLGGES